MQMMSWRHLSQGFFSGGGGGGDFPIRGDCTHITFIRQMSQKSGE